MRMVLAKAGFDDAQLAATFTPDGTLLATGVGELMAYLGRGSPQRGRSPPKFQYVSCVLNLL